MSKYSAEFKVRMTPTKSSMKKIFFHHDKEILPSFEGRIVYIVHLCVVVECSFAPLQKFVRGLDQIGNSLYLFEVSPNEYASQCKIYLCWTKGSAINDELLRESIMRILFVTINIIDIHVHVIYPYICIFVHRSIITTLASLTTVVSTGLFYKPKVSCHNYEEQSNNFQCHSRCFILSLNQSYNILLLVLVETTRLKKRGSWGQCWASTFIAIISPVIYALNCRLYKHLIVDFV